MNVFEHVEGLIRAALEAMKADGELPSDLEVSAIEAETPRDPSHGDFATNAAMVLAKKARQKPRDIAEKLKARLEADPDIEGAEVAGPGFLNIRFKASFWQRLVGAILAEGETYGRLPIGKGTKINVEYVSANPTGPMHVGHCRGAVFGDALANLLAFAGYDVTREYYVNDAGNQVDVLARSAFLRYREALGEDIGEIPEGLYPGDYLKPVGEALAKKHGRELLQANEDWLPVVRQTAIEMMMAMIREDLAALNIRHDVFFSEASLIQDGTDQVAAAIDLLKQKGLIYEGRLPKPKGHDDDEWEDREQILFRSTEFGDDVDRALVKSDGGYTYFASDIAYHYNKLQRGFEQLINVFGADHIGYISRMKATVAALSDRKASLDIKICQLVKLFRAGEPVRMSKRAGTFVTLRDVVDEVGRDPVRFMMLYRKNDAPLDFDFAKVTEQSKDNPVFYVQYAHARIASVFRNATQAFPSLSTSNEALAAADLSKLTDPGEIQLVKLLGSFPRVISGAVAAHEPHRLAFYLYDLAQALHSQYNRGNDSPHLRFIDSNDMGVTAARLAIISATRQVISSGLGVLGVEAPNAMR
ncbi:Arginine--tRNA ligase [Candidatus Filomicrobium marinum]|uniref:Arginine--tRNA ligase n=2 Tax=Filomicrobium TaxID=119044 RepID=A0A0D6JHH7_9HYPH|nr:MULTISPECIES: arginine--tRNA ligase [Filomicrobium]MCV0369714.1 arginine--tRNA ligase [Filomicrobium sp.]CFX48585.1 Arginine--tRNA ligase [Candidatus Filomicrobium marinum]CPR20417.1 Arginine--tRNA ligase [Candidatus Filomicrobium marinum]SDP14766.1 arginyl-tRNA synthetase [Filomicrobium insigne]